MYNRRKFLERTSALGALTVFPYSLGADVGFFKKVIAKRLSMDSLEERITQNVKAVLKDPLIIDNIELVLAQGTHFLRVRDTDGTIGVTQINWSRISDTLTLFKNLAAKNFIGKDAREIALLPDAILRIGRNYKYSGLPFWNAIGSIEIALWDLIGHKAKKPAHHFLGKQIRSSYPVYISSMERHKPISEELERIQTTVDATGASATKIKIGGRMKNVEPYIKRTNEYVPLARKLLGEDFTIYVDGNSSYTANEAIEVLKMLEGHNVAFFEEPCYWGDLWSHKKVKEKATTCAIAGGEQDTSLDQFRLMCEIQAMDILQPDTYYNGGLVRTLKVSYIAEEYGVGFTPHSPKVGPMAAGPAQVFAVCPKLTRYQEYRVGGEQEQKDWHSPFLPKNGHLEVPKGNGLGVKYASDLWAGEKVLWDSKTGF